MVMPKKDAPPKLDDWRKFFPEAGPSPDAPASDVERFLLLRYAQLALFCDRIIDYALHGVWDDPQDKVHRERRDATQDDCERLRSETLNIRSQFTTLKRWSTLVSGDDEPVGIDRDADLDALASEICRRIGKPWTGASATTKKRVVFGVEGPSSSAPLGVKLAFFQRQYGDLSRQSDCLGRRSRDCDTPAKRTLLKIADNAIKTKRDTLTERSKAIGALVERGTSDTQRAIDSFTVAITLRQRAMRMKNHKVPKLPTLKWFVKHARAARAGDYLSYRALNGYTESSAGARWSPLHTGKEHLRMIRDRTADLRCKKCGKYHCQNQTPVYDPELDIEVAPAVTCPNCGLKDCAGQRFHRIAAFRGMGKSTEGRMELGYRTSLYIHRDYVPEMALVGANEDEAHKRQRLVVNVMRRPAHRVIFPRAVPRPNQNVSFVRVQGIDQAVIVFYGIESIPPGMHPDAWYFDDVVNEHNTFAVPAKMETVRSKMNNVVNFAMKPWSTLDWDTTVWRVDDPDHDLERESEQHPDVWTNFVSACNGPQARDGKPAWFCPWQEMFLVKVLQRLWDRDELAYRRSMMLERVTAQDICFQRASAYITDRDPLLGSCPSEFLKECHVIRYDEMLSWPHVAGWDLGFTAEDKADRKRSKTAGATLAMDPARKIKYFRDILAVFIAPSEHEGLIEKKAHDFRNADIFIETDKTVTEIVERLRSRNLMVDTYNPSTLGDKKMRKFPVAADFNSGRAMLPGCLKCHAGSDPTNPSSWEVVLTREGAKAWNAMRVFPSRTGDVLDAIEIADRMAEQYYGGDPEPEVAEKTAEQVPALGTWGAMRRSQPEPMTDADALDAVVGNLDDDLVAAGVLGDPLFATSEGESFDDIPWN